MPDLYSPAPDLAPLNTAKLRDSDHRHVGTIARHLLDVAEVDPSGSVLVGELTFALNKHLRTLRRRGIPTSTVRRAIQATGFRTHRAGDDNAIHGLRLRQKPHKAA